MTTEFSHLAIAVQDIDRVKSLFELISGNSITEKKSIQNQKINAAFLDIGPVSYTHLRAHETLR